MGSSWKSSTTRQPSPRQACRRRCLSERSSSWRRWTATTPLRPPPLLPSPPNPLTCRHGRNRPLRWRRMRKRLPRDPLTRRRRHSGERRRHRRRRRRRRRSGGSRHRARTRRRCRRRRSSQGRPHHRSSRLHREDTQAPLQALGHKQRHRRPLSRSARRRRRRRRHHPAPLQSKALQADLAVARRRRSHRRRSSARRLDTLARRHRRHRRRPRTVDRWGTQGARRSRRSSREARQVTRRTLTSRDILAWAALTA